MLVDGPSRRARRARPKTAAISARGVPNDRARRSHWDDSSPKSRPARLSGRVAAHATRAPRVECAPCSAMCLRMSAERDENSPRSNGDTPSTSARSPGASTQRMPRRDVSSTRRCASYTADCSGAMGRQSPVVARAPLAVESVHQVGHHNMGVQMRVEIAVHPVGERCRHQTRRRHDLPLLTRAPPRRERMRLEVAKRALHALRGAPRRPGGPPPLHPARRPR